MKNKEHIWKSKENVRWRIEGNNPKDQSLVAISGEKVPERKDSNETKFWLRWDDEETNIVIPGKEEQVWKQTSYPDNPDYFTLENMDSDKVLTAVNGSLQLEGMF